MSDSFKCNLFAAKEKEICKIWQFYNSFAHNRFAVHSSLCRIKLLKFEAKKQIFNFFYWLFGYFIYISSLLIKAIFMGKKKSYKARGSQQMSHRINSIPSSYRLDFIPVNLIPSDIRILGLHVVRPVVLSIIIISLLLLSL